MITYSREDAWHTARASAHRAVLDQHTLGRSKRASRGLPETHAPHTLLSSALHVLGLVVRSACFKQALRGPTCVSVLIAARCLAP